jgi:hypothetical protein
MTTTREKIDPKKPRNPRENRIPGSPNPKKTPKLACCAGGKKSETPENAEKTTTFSLSDERPQHTNREQIKPPIKPKPDPKTWKFRNLLSNSPLPTAAVHGPSRRLLTFNRSKTITTELRFPAAKEKPIGNYSPQKVP